MTTETTQTTDKKTPTHILKLLPGESGKNAYPVRMGVIWETKKGNLRLSFDLIPDSTHLHRDIIVAVPFEQQDEPVEDIPLN